MFEFVFELIDLFFTFYPKSIDIKIVLWNTFENVQNKKIIATCMRKHNLCSLVFFFAASLPLSFLYSTPWTEISSTLNFRFKQNLDKKSLCCFIVFILYLLNPWDWNQQAYNLNLTFCSSPKSQKFKLLCGALLVFLWNFY